MTENDSFGGQPFIVGRKVVSREGAAIYVEQLMMSQAWYDNMARAIERGREDARQRMLSYRIKRFFSNLLARFTNSSSRG